MSKGKKVKRVQPVTVSPVDLGSIRYSVTVYTSDQIDDLLSNLPSQEELERHINDKNNPHEVTKSQVGLGNVDNTSDKNKPVSDEVNAQLGYKANMEEPWSLSWTDGEGSHTTERMGVFDNLRLWMFNAYERSWIVAYTGGNIWIAIIDNDEEHQVHGRISGGFIDPYDVIFTYNDVNYSFRPGLVDVVTHPTQNDNPHNVTGQQVGVLDSSGKIKSNLVDTASIMDQKVTTAKLAYNSVPDSRLQGSASSGITSSHFQDNAFNGQKIVAASVSKAKLSTTVQDAIDKNVNASVSVQSPSHVVTQAGGLIIKGLDDNWWSIGIDANGDIYKTRVDPPTLSTNMASETETLPDDYMEAETETSPDDYTESDNSNE